LRGPFNNNKVDPSLFSPAALNLTGRLPTTTDPCGQIRFGRRAGYNDHQSLGRVDYQLGKRHSLFGRYMDVRQDVPTDYDSSNVLTFSLTNQIYRFYSFVLGDTYSFGSNMVAAFRGTVNRLKNQKNYPAYFDLHDLGVKDVYVKFPGYVLVTVTNGFTI